MADDGVLKIALRRLDMRGDPATILYDAGKPWGQ